MNRNVGAMNPFQLVAAIAKLVILLLLPVVGLAIAGFNIPGVSITGISMLKSGNLLGLLPLLLYGVMMVLSLGELQKYSVIVACVALVMEIVLFSMAGVIIQMGDVSALLKLIPQEYKVYSDFALAQLAKPGLGLILNLVLTLVYIACAFVGSAFSGGSGRSSAGNRTRNEGTITRGNNRPRL